MTWKIKSLIFVLVLLCVPAAAITLYSEATIHDREVSVTSRSTGQAPIHDSVASKSASQAPIHDSVTSKSASQATIHDGNVSMTSKSRTEATVAKGDIYTISLKESPSTDYKWTVTHSSGLELISDTLGSDGKRELKFRAVQTGRQTIQADCSKSREENLKLTSEFVLNVV